MTTDGGATELSKKWIPLATFQLNVAQRWQKRGCSTDDVFAQFFFYFAGFNALYFLWGKVDDVRNRRGEPAGEEKQIHDLLTKVPRATATALLEDLESTLYYFRERRPIQRMDRRDAEHPIDGETDEGRKWRARLGEKDAASQLKALGSILYLVRCNLAHGSKKEAGDDEQVIQQAVPAVRQLLRHGIELTKEVMKRATR